VSNTYTPSTADGLASGSQVRVLINAYRQGHGSYYNTTAGVTLS
jgi:hypothetical protein